MVYLGPLLGLRLHPLALLSPAETETLARSSLFLFADFVIL